MLLSALFYGLLLLLPADGNVKQVTQHGEVTFACNLDGGHIFQERCGDSKLCHNMANRAGKVDLTNCVYTCQKPTKFEKLHSPNVNEFKRQPLPQLTTPVDSSSEPNYDYDASDFDPAPVELKVHKNFIEPPHICQKQKRDSNQTGDYTCHPYSGTRDHISLEVSAAENYLDSVNDSFTADWCRYKLGESTQ